MAGHSEKDLEDAIEAHLLGNGWVKGSAADFDTSLGLDPVTLASFVQQSQPKEWDKLVTAYGPAAGAKFAKRVADEIDVNGTVKVLRGSVKDRGAHVRLAFFKPTHGLTPDLVTLYEANKLGVYRNLSTSVGQLIPAITERPPPSRSVG